MARRVGLFLLALVGCREPTQLVVVVDSAAELSSSIDRVRAWSSLGAETPDAPADATTFELVEHGPLPLSYAIVPGDDREGALFVHLRAEDDTRSADVCLRSGFVDNERVVVVGRFERWCSKDCPPCVPAEPCGVDGSDIAAAVAACGPESWDAGSRDGGTPVHDAGVDRDGGDMDRRDGGVARDGGTADAGVERDGGTNRDSGIPPLVETGLVLRYFLDEDPRSQAARRAVDSAPGTPLNLERMTSPNGPDYVDGSAGRSASWGAPGGAGAFAELASQKVLTALLDGRRATIEIVVEDLGSSSATSGLVHLGPTSFGALGLYVTQDQLILALDGSTDIRWNVALGGPLREVITVVIDTSQPSVNDRIDLYLDGSPGPLSQLGPDRHRSINLVAGDSVFIGNLPGASASVGGRIGYVAIYDRPLTPAEVADNASSLRVSHDTR